jgi:hypothetical protein
VNWTSSVLLLSQQLKDNPAATTVDILGFISHLEKYVLTQHLAGRAHAEVDYVQKINILHSIDRCPVLTSWPLPSVFRRLWGASAQHQTGGMQFSSTIFSSLRKAQDIVWCLH